MAAKFIVIEGIDGAGTSTQTALLERALAQRGLMVHATREPTDGTVGTLLRSILTKSVEAPVHPHTLALLFAADRLEHVGRDVTPRLARNEWVISDRYDYSSVAYQSASAESAALIGWLRDINRYAPRPALTVVLDVTPEVALARRVARDTGRELFDDEALQRHLARFYAAIDDHFPDDRIVHIDGDPSQDSVAEAILAQVLPLVE